jgi:hypothetical protein
MSLSLPGNGPLIRAGVDSNDQEETATRETQMEPQR